MKVRMYDLTEHRTIYRLSAEKNKIAKASLFFCHISDRYGA